jgi:predicted nuclease of predicted toxin-antitoxin system
MKIKLDENLGRRCSEMLRSAGFDVTTVAEQGLCSTNDHFLIEACQKEERCLVTLDVDFGNPLIFRPPDFAGIVVLRLPSKATPEDLISALGTMIGACAKPTSKESSGSCSGTGLENISRRRGDWIEKAQGVEEILPIKVRLC